MILTIIPLLLLSYTLIPSSYTVNASKLVDRLQAELPSSGIRVSKRDSAAAPARSVPPEGYYNPAANGGHMLTEIPITYPMGQGEPLNAIISGNSDQRVLVDSETNGGLRNYFLSFGFSGECLGQHSGSDQAANLGDGNGSKNETAVIRWNYGDAQLGACKETIQGGNHFRYWVQNGPQANSGAVFIAASYEKPLAFDHDIIPNGYNLGRDWLVGNITKNPIPTGNISDGTVLEGTTSWANWTYQTDIKFVTGLLANTNDAINHNWTVVVPGFNSSDGIVAVLNVQITGTPPKSAAWRPSPPRLWEVSSLSVILALYFLPAFLLS